MLVNTTPPATPAARGPFAPGRIRDNVAQNATVVAVNWDPSFAARDRQTGFTTAPTKEGSTAITAAWAGTDLARDRVIGDLSQGDVYQKALVSVFAEAVARNEAALAALVSNYPMGSKFQPKNGTFDFVMDRPGTDNDLRYVGVIEAAPAPIKAILDAATGFRTHFGR